MRSDLTLRLGDTGKRAVPARLKLAGDQPVRRIGGVVLPEGTVGGIARRFKIAAKGLAHLIPLVRGLGGRGRRRGDGARSDHAEQRLFDGVINPQTAEGDAMGATSVHPGATTAVARNAVPCARIPQRQLPTAPPAADQPGKQRVAVLGRAVMLAGWNVA